MLQKIYLFQGLPKSDKMELIIQKAVELGVYEIDREQAAFVLKERAPGVTVEQIREATAGKLIMEGDIPEMQL